MLSPFVQFTVAFPLYDSMIYEKRQSSSILPFRIRQLPPRPYYSTNSLSISAKVQGTSEPVPVPAASPFAAFCQQPFMTWFPPHRHSQMTDGSSEKQLALTNGAKLFSWMDFLRNVFQGEVGSNTDRTSSNMTSNPIPVRIGILGGGIAGISVAHALVKRLGNSTTTRPYEIVIWEADPHSTTTTTTHQQPPPWTSATARNANSMVPAAAMHVFSRRSTLWNLASDTFLEFYLEWKLKYKGWCQSRAQQLSNSGDKPLATSMARYGLPPEDLFLQPPPYFAVHLIRCLGPHATHDERVSFVRFASQFLFYSLFRGGEKADERGRILVHLAQANRAMYLGEFLNRRDYPDLEQSIGHSQGFLSVHRTLSKAQAVVKKAHEHGEDARILEWDEAVEKEPTLERIPVRPLYVVHRPHDCTANCLAYYQMCIQNLLKNNKHVQYRVAKIGQVKNVGSPEKPLFSVATKDSPTREELCDYLILAAGVETPLWAACLGAGNACPTYPLRGYSLTLFTPWQESVRDRQQGNLLHQAFALDSMYCSSVTPWMARWAGFGEFVGYRDKAVSVPSVAPAVMERYARAIFPGATTIGPAVQCFRPMSPDDLPLVGAVGPGLYIHTGHGTLGWTIGMATGDCLAQILEEKMNGAKSNDFFVLANGSSLPRKHLSPKRFLWN